MAAKVGSWKSPRADRAHKALARPPLCSPDLSPSAESTLVASSFEEEALFCACLGLVWHLVCGMPCAAAVALSTFVGRADGLKWNLFQLKYTIVSGSSDTLDIMKV
jgi:hypothetical protein